MKKLQQYLSLVKFSHSIFALPFAAIGFSLAWFYWQREVPAANGAATLGAATAPGVQALLVKLLLVLVCMVTARNAAMAFNRYLDRRFDALNPRTATREIPAGVLAPANVLVFTMVNCILFIVATFFINPICFWLAPIALAVILGYSYTKRFTPFCHLILGVGLALAPIGAYLAVTGSFALLPLLFSFTVLCWVSGFDILYALQDEAFDREQALQSMPAWLGASGALKVSRALHVIAAGLVLAAGVYGNFGLLYWSGALVFWGMLVYQQSLVKPNDLSKVNLAFMTANGIASIVFAAFVIADIFLFKQSLQWPG